MKRIIIFFVFSAISICTFAETCPNADKVVYFSGGRYVVNAPYGWNLVEEKNIYDQVRFNIAAWGDHHKYEDNIRCYYYNSGGRGSVELQSWRSYSEDKITSSGGNWSNDSERYHLCSVASGNVFDCTFG